MRVTLDLSTAGIALLVMVVACVERVRLSDNIRFTFRDKCHMRAPGSWIAKSTDFRM